MINLFLLWHVNSYVLQLFPNLLDMIGFWELLESSTFPICVSNKCSNIFSGVPAITEYLREYKLC